MKRLLSILALVVFVSGLTYAHHGWTGYDESKPIELKGSIKASGYENPHGFVDLQVDKQVWRVVLAPPSRMEGRGLPKDRLKVGATATVVGYQHRQDKNELRAERITIDGKTVELR